MTASPYYHQHEFPAYHSTVQENCRKEDSSISEFKKNLQSHRDEKKKNDAMSADMRT
jgi:hypothetical protein